MIPNQSRKSVSEMIESLVRDVSAAAPEVGAEAAHRVVLSGVGNVNIVASSVTLGAVPVPQGVRRDA